MRFSLPPLHSLRALIPALLLAAALLLSGNLAAQTPAVEFLGQKFEKKFEGGNPQNASRFVEFGLPPEPIKQWTKMVSYRHFPKSEPDTKKAATVLGQLVKQRDKDARLAIITNDKTQEAIIDFLIGQGETMEFNVFKYTKAPGGGLVATQYAIRFKLGEMDGGELKKIRTAAVNEMAKFDQSKAFAYFGLK